MRHFCHIIRDTAPYSSNMIKLLDTPPGHNDFQESTYRTLGAVD